MPCCETRSAYCDRKGFEFGDGVQQSQKLEAPLRASTCNPAQLGSDSTEAMVALRPPLLRPGSTAATLATVAVSGLAVCLLCAAAWFAALAIQATGAYDNLADEAVATQFASDTVLSTLKDAETGQRGYLLTGNPRYLAPYETARARLDTDFDNLLAAPLMDAGLTGHIAVIRNLSADKLAELGRTIALERGGDHLAALALVRTDQGELLMDEIRAEMSRLQADLNVEIRNAHTLSNVPWRWAGTAAISALACALLAWVAVMQRRARLLASANLVQLGRFAQAFGLAQGMMRGLDGEIRLWSQGAERLYGYRPDEAVGQVSHTLLRTEFPQPRAEIEASLQREGQWQGQLVHRRRDGAALTVASHWALHRGEAGEPDMIIEVNNDLSGHKRAEQGRQRADALLSTIVSTAPGLIYAKDRQGRITIANQATLDLIGKPWSEVEGRTDMELLDDPEQAARVMANDCRLMQEGKSEELEESVGTSGGEPRVWFSTKAPLRDETGATIGLMGISVEVTERKRVEERLRLMVNELNHRVKNTLAVVQAIASQTLRGADPAFGRALEGRLLALASVHDVLTRESWEGAELREVVAACVAPGGPEAARVHVSGPALRLSPRAAIALALALNEMAVNARTHGALSTELGEVEIRWQLARDLLVPALRLAWTERGGPAVSPPSRRGFGTRIIERSLAQDLGGTVRLSFADPKGVTCVIEAPLDEIVAPAAVLPFPAVGRA